MNCELYLLIYKTLQSNVDLGDLGHLVVIVRSFTEMVKSRCLSIILCLLQSWYGSIAGRQ